MSRKCSNYTDQLYISLLSTCHLSVILRSTFGVDSGILTYLVGATGLWWPRFIKISDQFGTGLGEKYTGDEEEEEQVWAVIIIIIIYVIIIVIVIIIIIIRFDTYLKRRQQVVRSMEQSDMLRN